MMAEKISKIDARVLTRLVLSNVCPAISQETIQSPIKTSCSCLLSCFSFTMLTLTAQDNPPQQRWMSLFMFVCVCMSLRDVPIRILPTHSVIGAEYVFDDGFPSPNTTMFPLYGHASPIRFNLRKGGLITLSYPHQRRCAVHSVRLVALGLLLRGCHLHQHVVGILSFPSLICKVSRAT